MLGALNIDYRADRIAFRRLMRARQLLDQFHVREAVEPIFRAAERAVGEDSYLLHQRAIFEMNLDDANLQRATDYLARAEALAPQDRTNHAQNWHLGRQRMHLRRYCSTLRLEKVGGSRSR